MKKRRSGSSGKSGGGSKGGFSTGRSSGSGSTARSGKKSFFSSGPKVGFGGKKPFRKPPNDPGPKTGSQPGEILDEYAGEGQAGGVQQALQSTGCGCCSSIAGIMWLFALGAVAVVVILAVKCGGC